MTEIYEHNKGDHEDPLAGATWIVGVLGTVILTVIIFGLTALYYGTAEEIRDVEVVGKTISAVEIEKQSIDTLYEPPHTVTEMIGEGDEATEQTVYRIPIDRAMTLIIDEYGDQGQ